MALLTLAEASKLGLDDLKAGVVENIVTVDGLYQLLPFTGINGNALKYNRENVLADAQGLAVNGTITANNAATYTSITTGLYTFIGDAKINGLLQAQNVGGNAGNDPVQAQVASKAKSVGRLFSNAFINGDTTSGDANLAGFDGLIKLTDSTQIIDANQAALDFGMLDELTQAVISKGSQVDFIAMPAKGIRKVAALLRALGGTTADYVEINGVRFIMYNGIPIIRNDWIPTNLGVGTDESYVFAGNFEDGGLNGIVGLTSVENAGVNVDYIGASETSDSDIWRVKFYAGLANYSKYGLAHIKEVKF